MATRHRTARLFKGQSKPANECILSSTSPCKLGLNALDSGFSNIKKHGGVHASNADMTTIYSRLDILSLHRGPDRSNKETSVAKKHSSKAVTRRLYQKLTQSPTNLDKQGTSRKKNTVVLSDSSNHVRFCNDEVIHSKSSSTDQGKPGSVDEISFALKTRLDFSEPGSYWAETSSRHKITARVEDILSVHRSVEESSPDQLKRKIHKRQDCRSMKRSVNLQTTTDNELSMLSLRHKCFSAKGRNEIKKSADSNVTHSSEVKNLNFGAEGSYWLPAKTTTRSRKSTVRYTDPDVVDSAHELKRRVLYKNPPHSALATKHADSRDQAVSPAAKAVYKNQKPLTVQSKKTITQASDNSEGVTGIEEDIQNESESEDEKEELGRLPDELGFSAAGSYWMPVKSKRKPKVPTTVLADQLHFERSKSDATRARVHRSRGNEAKPSPKKKLLQKQGATRAKTKTDHEAMSEYSDASSSYAPSEVCEGSLLGESDDDTEYQGSPAKQKRTTHKHARSKTVTPGTASRKLPKLSTITPSLPKRTSLTFLDPNKTVLESIRERLHVSSVPDYLPCRENEFSQIYTFIEHKICAGTGGCMYISGVPGSGKTAVAHEVIKTLQNCASEGELPFFRYVEINGMKLTQPKQAYAEIVWELTGERVTVDHAVDLLQNRFSVGNPGRSPLLLLVDELDLLWTSRQQVLYNLFDWPSRPRAKLVVIAIANTMDLPERILMNRVASRLGLTRLSFQPYSFRQLQEIVSSRLEGARAFDPDAVQLAARKVAAVSGDARRVLDICRRAAELAESDIPTPVTATSQSNLPSGHQPTTPTASSQANNTGLNTQPTACTTNSTGGVTASSTCGTNSQYSVRMVHITRALNELFSTPIVNALRLCSEIERQLMYAVVCEIDRVGVEEISLARVYKQLTALLSFEGYPKLPMSKVTTLVHKLASCRLLLVENGQRDLLARVRLNVSKDDVLMVMQGQNNRS